MTHPYRFKPRSFARIRSLRCALACALTLFVAPITMLASASPAAAADTSQFKGVNWARPLDNFVDGPVVPEGLSTSDSYSTVQAKANAILSGFQSNLGANTVRLPINTYSVPGTTWGDAYTGAIDAAIAKGFKVILGYWEDGASSGGRIVNMSAFNLMWNAVTAKYGSNSQVYFEPMNEPHGYSGTEWADIAATWINNHPSVPKGRVVVSGEGYNDRVNSLCTDNRFRETLLSVHLYAFGSLDHDYPGWVSELKNRIGSCASRTILDEFGAPMAEPTVLNYNTTNSSNDYVRYLRAMTDTVRALGMGSVYWPALGGKHNENPDFDYYSLFALQGSGTNLSLSIRNQSGIDRVKFGYGDGPGSIGAIRNIGAGSKCLDVPGATSDNVQAIVYNCNYDDNQTWTKTPSGQITVYGGTKCLDAYGKGTSNFTVVGIYDCNNGDNQKWVFYPDGTIRGLQSNLCLDVELSNSKLQLYDCWGGDNQKWQAF